MNISVKRISKIFLLVVNEFSGLLLGVKKQKAWNNTREKYMPEKRRQNLPETDRGSCYNKEEWVEEFIDDKGAFCNGSGSDDGNNDDENYNENMKAVVHRCSSK